MLNGADNSSSLVKRKSSEPESIMVRFVDEVMTNLQSKESPAKDDLLKSFVFASLALPQGERDAILDHIKAHSEDFLKATKKPKKEEEIVLPQMMLAHAVRTKGIPAFLEIVIPFAVDFLPAGQIMKRFLVPTLNFSAGFLAELIKEYCNTYQRSASPSLMNRLSSGLTLTSDAASSTWQRFGRLIRRNKQVPVLDVRTTDSPSESPLVILTNQPLLILSSSQPSSFPHQGSPSSSVVIEEVNEEDPSKEKKLKR